MKSFNTKTATLLALLGLLFAVPVHAEPTFQLSPELAGLQKVLRVISNTNLEQTDIKTNQSLLDILDEKSQMYLPGRQAQVVESSQNEARRNAVQRPAMRAN